MFLHPNSRPRQGLLCRHVCRQIAFLTHSPVAGPARTTIFRNRDIDMNTRARVVNVAPVPQTKIRLALLFLFSVIIPLVAQNTVAIDMKVDRVTINTSVGGSAEWAEVTFQETFGSVPMVFALPTNSNSDPATLRIRNVTTTGFEIGLTEPTGSDGQTSAMTVDYFAAETGTYNFAGGVRVIVGSHTTSTQQGRFISGANWDDVNFSSTFATPPAVIAQVQTINSQPPLDAGINADPFIEVAIRNVTTSDVDMALERAETRTGTLIAETIGYLAMESGDQVSIEGETINATLTPDNVSGWNNGCYVRNFSTGFGTTPLVVASQNSRDGGDGGWVRRCSISDSAVGLTIDEDVDNDTDRSHTTEEVGVLAISGAFNGSRNGQDMEAGSVSIAGTVAPTQWTSVSFPNEFSVTPYIFSLPTESGTLPAALRVRNVTTNGFDIAAFQPFGGTGSHPEMDIDYLAIIPGEHTLPNGDVFEVGAISTNRYLAGTGGSTGTENIGFASGFSGPPALLLDIQSINNEALLDPITISSPWMVTAVSSLASGSADIAIERAESISGTISSPETIAYFAARDGANESLDATDGSTIDYEMFITPDNILGFTDGCFNNNYSETYASPYAIATQSTRDGNNGGWVRRCNLETSRIGLSIDEDQSNDSERTHTTEEVSVFVFSKAFEAEFNLIDHYAIFHSNSGVTCEAETVTIAAHDASELGVEAGGRTITITATSSSPGWSASDATWTLSSGSGLFSTPAPGVAEYQFDTGESSLELLLANVSNADIDIDVVDNDPTLTDREGSSEDPILSFSDTGFRFYNDADGDGDPDGTDPIASPLTAGVVSGQLILQGIETDTLSGACQGRVIGAQTVSFAYECVDPTSCVRNSDANINGTAIAENDLNTINDFTDVTVTFDSQGEAPFNLEYFDVGNIRLHAELSIPAGGGQPAVTLSGASGITTVRPHALVVTQVSDGAGNNNLGTTTTGAGFVASDTTFSVTVEARNEDGGLTPNYGEENAPEGITLEAVSLILPSVGDLPALISPSSFTSTSTGGEFENIVVRWPEAGTITLRAVIGDGDYLGAGSVVTSPESSHVGRFYPDRFRLVNSATVNGCDSGNFSYMSDQALSYTPISLNYSVEAVTASLVRLQNYDDTYPVSNFVFAAENDDDGNDRSLRMAFPTSPWNNGLTSVINADNTGFTRALVGVNEQPDGPYSNLQISISVSPSAVDDTTNFTTAAFDQNPETSGDCSATNSCDSLALGGTLDVRFGRLAISNAHGPETASLAVGFEAQSWDLINGFQINRDDSCTQLMMSDIVFDGNDLVDDGNRVVNLDGTGSTTGSFNIFDPGLTMTFINGDAGLNFSAPGAGNSGEFDVDIDLSKYPWLRSDWNQDGDHAAPSNLPSANIRFGRYRGHDRIIFWQEVLN